MKSAGTIIMALYFSCVSIFANDFKQPDDGLTFGAITKINQEVQLIYENTLKDNMRQYIQGKLKFTDRICQIRDPQTGCLTFSKRPGFWSLRADLITSEAVKLRGFHKLIFNRYTNKKRTLHLYDSRGRVIQFPFRQGRVQNPIVPLGKSKISYEKIENIVFEMKYIYNTLKPAMDHYSGEQWDYPLNRCDRNLLSLGCVSYQKSSDLRIIFVKLNQQTASQLFGFSQIYYRNRLDGLGELELSAHRRRTIFFPITNGRLEDVFIPMHVADTLQQ
ncbi:MAG: hypothetical protein HQM14_06980 [SAR324 cluster bacterium]|nr:hypothetical protein [SAR324 cluster bacterium]